MLAAKEIVATLYNDEEAKEVMEYLLKVSPNKTEFKSSRTFLNHLGRKLQPSLKRKERNAETPTQRFFWENRIMSVAIEYPINKPKNVLWCIRLLEGRAVIPE